MQRSVAQQHQRVRGSYESGQRQAIFDLVSGTSHHNTKSVKSKGKKKKRVKKPFKTHASGGHMGSIVIGAASANAAGDTPFVSSGGPGRHTPAAWRSAGTPKNRAASHSEARFNKTLGAHVRKGPFGPELYSQKMSRWMPVSSKGRAQAFEAYREADENVMDTEQGESADPLATRRAQGRINDHISRMQFGKGREQLMNLMNTGNESSSAAQSVSTGREATNSVVNELGKWNPQTGSRFDMHRPQLMKELKRGGVNDATTKTLAAKLLREQAATIRPVNIESIVKQAVEKTPEEKLRAVEQKAGMESSLSTYREKAMKVDDPAQKHGILKQIDAISKESSLDTKDRMLQLFGTRYNTMLDEAAKKQMDTEPEQLDDGDGEPARPLSDIVADKFEENARSARMSHWIKSTKKRVESMKDGEERSVMLSQLNTIAKAKGGEQEEFKRQFTSRYDSAMETASDAPEKSEMQTQTASEEPEKAEMQTQTEESSLEQDKGKRKTVRKSKKRPAKEVPVEPEQKKTEEPKPAETKPGTPPPQLPAEKPPTPPPQLPAEKPPSPVPQMPDPQEIANSLGTNLSRAEEHKTKGEEHLSGRLTKERMEDRKKVFKNTGNPEDKRQEKRREMQQRTKANRGKKLNEKRDIGEVQMEEPVQAEAPAEEPPVEPTPQPPPKPEKEGNVELEGRRRRVDKTDIDDDNANPVKRGKVPQGFEEPDVMEETAALQPDQ